VVARRCALGKDT